MKSWRADFELAGLDLHAVLWLFMLVLCTPQAALKNVDKADTKAPRALLDVERHLPHLGGYAYRFIWPLALSFPGYFDADLGGL